MKKLHDNWLTEGLIDYEYKKYIVLAYLQSARKELDAKKLYPTFSDLIFHYQNLLKIKENKSLIYESFPKEISKADFERLELSYRSIVQDDEMMRIIEEIIYFSLPKFKQLLLEGKEIYENIEKSLEIIQVGLSSLYTDEGYLMLSEYKMRETKIYQYQITVFKSAYEQFRGINLTYLESITKGIGETYENVKINLVKKYKTFQNPSTYLIVSKIPCPLEETFIPVAKRLLVKTLSIAS
ncbi:MAG: hypothetical protein NZ521_01740 [Flammeovirgaceae bacterium]|nr:hypothetical protein [Flammeovirgaceae bacterium]MDW8286901.1 hypothetical protein [Flammeovirgaceae bacterium]